MTRRSRFSNGEISGLTPLLGVAFGLIGLFATTVEGAASGFDESTFLLAVGQADLADMPALFAQVGENRDPMMQELRAGFEARFVERSESLSPETGDAFVDGLVTAFREYWTEALLAPPSAAAALARLERRLAGLLESAGAGGSGNPFDAAVAAAEAAGYGVSVSTTAPLHDLVLWTDEERAHYRVDLTDGAETVEVVFLDGLVSEGWRRVAGAEFDHRLDRRRRALLRRVGLRPRLREVPGDLPEKHFLAIRVSTRRQYRAKLTELAYAGTSARELLRRFTESRSAAGPNVHAIANDRVARDMYQEIFDRPMPEHLDAWSLLGADRINPAARRLLERNTRELQ